MLQFKPRFVYLNVVVAFCFDAGGLFFGWNALSIMIKDLGNYSSGCDDVEISPGVKSI